MQVHTLVFIHEHGPAIGTYPIVSHGDERTDEANDAMQRRYDLACKNPSCIAAFWYVDGSMKQFSFLRA